jgi:hypothetical protein
MLVSERDLNAMSEILFGFLIILGLGVALGSAMEAIRKRNAVWYALSALLPCLYGLLGFLILGLIDGRGLNIPAAAFSGLFLLALGWLGAWQDKGVQRRAKLAQLDEIEQRVIDDQSYIDEWQRIVTQMDRDGHDATEARVFLEGLRQSKTDYLARRDRILKEFEQYGVRGLADSQS